MLLKLRFAGSARAYSAIGSFPFQYHERARSLSALRAAALQFFRGAQLLELSLLFSIGPPPP